MERKDVAKLSAEEVEQLVPLAREHGLDDLAFRLEKESENGLVITSLAPQAASVVRTALQQYAQTRMPNDNSAHLAKAVDSIFAENVAVIEEMPRDPQEDLTKEMPVAVGSLFEKEDKAAKAFERIADQLEHLGKIGEAWFRQNPKHDQLVRELEAERHQPSPRRD